MARLILVKKPDKADTNHVKAYRPIRLLPTLGKSLVTIIISGIEKGMTMNSHDEHKFTVGRWTISALEKV